MKKTEQSFRVDLDERDQKILQLLLQNSRLSYRQIAKKLLMSVATAMHRVKKLEDAKIIRKFAVHLDYEKLGYDLTAIIQVRVMKGKFFEVGPLIARHPSVQAVYDVTGPFDAIVIAKFKNRRDLDHFVKKIQAYELIERTETNVVLNITKEDFAGIV